MHLLSALLDELSSVEILRSRVRGDIAICEADYVILSEQAKWLVEHVEQKIKFIASLQYGDMKMFLLALEETYGLHVRSTALLDRLTEKKEVLRRLARDEETVELLAQIRIFLRRFVSTFLSVESSEK